MTKLQQIVERVVVTFIQAALAYVIVIPNPQLNKTVIAGAVGAGLSAVYNGLRQSTPPTTNTPVPVEPVAPPTAV